MKAGRWSAKDRERPPWLHHLRRFWSNLKVRVSTTYAKESAGGGLDADISMFKRLGESRHPQADGNKPTRETNLESSRKQNPNVVGQLKSSKMVPPSMAYAFDVVGEATKRPTARRKRCFRRLMRCALGRHSTHPVPESADRGWLQHDLEQDDEGDVTFSNTGTGNVITGSCEWLIDGGSTCHVLGHVQQYLNHITNRRPANISIRVGGGARFACRQIGDVVLQLPTPNLKHILVQDVRLVPGFKANVLSESRMERAGWSLLHSGGTLTAWDRQGQCLFQTKAGDNGLYVLKR